DRKPVEMLSQRCLLIEMLDQATLPRRSEIEGGNERSEEAHIAGEDEGLFDSIQARRFEPEREHFCVGDGSVGAAEGLDPGLEEFRRLAFVPTRGLLGAACRFPIPKHGAEITIALSLSRSGRTKIFAADRYGEVRPQAEFAS